MNEQDNTDKKFTLENFKLKPISSTENIKSTFVIDENEEDILSLNAALKASGETDNESNLKKDESSTEIEDPIFKELSVPTLPELDKENRARLQMQSPNKIYFYWSFKENPFRILNRVFGNQTNYQLVAKLLNQTNRREELFPIDTDGSTWFDVDADSSYQAEIGFYAVNRPFVRVLFSNTLQTPRKNPSPRQDYSEYFAVSADQFAKVLDVSGFQQDALEVALAGDDVESADRATENAFSQMFDSTEDTFAANESSELRFVLLALASGYSLQDLREHIRPSLFAFLQNHAEKLSTEKASAALQANFDISIDEIYEEESFGETVHGASLISFPRTLKQRTLPAKHRTLSKFTPISSLR